MGSTVGQILPFAIGVGVNPLPVIAVILLLLTPRARATGLSFLAGWLAGLILIGGIAIAIANRTDLYGAEGSSLATWVSLLLGVLVLGLAVKQWLGRPAKGEASDAPAWMAALDQINLWRALRLGALLAAANPKNLVLTLTAAVIIVEGGHTGAQEALALAVFVIVASIGVAVPIVAYFALGSKASSILEGWRAWLVRNNATIMSLVLGVIGLLLVVLAVVG